MNNFQKAKDILDLVVAAAAAIVTIVELWEKHGPEVKKALKPVLDGCKKLNSSSSNATLVITETK